MAYLHFHLDDCGRASFRWESTPQSTGVWSNDETVIKFPSEEMKNKILGERGWSSAKLVVSSDIDFRKIPGLSAERLYRVPVLKSALQKSIRRSMGMTSVRLANQFLCQEYMEFVRRFPIIMIEDSAVHHQVLPLCVWIMCAGSKDPAAGSGACAYFKDVLLDAVLHVSLCPCRDILAREGSGASADRFFNLIEFDGSTVDTSVCSALLLRACYGGMAGDITMLENSYVAWKERHGTFTASQWTSAAFPQDIRVPPGESLQLQEVDKLWEAIDQHCAPYLISQFRSRIKNASMTDERIRNCIWNHQSSVYSGKHLLLNGPEGPYRSELMYTEQEQKARAATHDAWLLLEHQWALEVAGSRMWDEILPSVGDEPLAKRLRPVPLDAEAPPAKKLRVETLPNEARSLTDEQQEVLNLVQARQSVFFTGCAGTGKSFLMRTILESVAPDTTFVTAPTGVAAVNISGMTLHSFAGIGKGEGEVSDLMVTITRNRQSLKRWKTCKILIIDEVSMLDCSLFAKLEEIARIVRKCASPFGGIQLVLSGDFFQLPPVSKTKTHFVFNTPVWARMNFAVVHLQKVFRQKDDTFVKILSEVRTANCSPETVECLRKRCRPFEGTKGSIIPTKLRARNEEVDSVNNTELQRLEGKLYIFKARDFGESSASIADGWAAPKELRLAEGAQVVLLKNLDVPNGLVNGTRGVVLGFTDNESYSSYINDFDEEKDKYSLEEEPVGYPVVRFTHGVTRCIRAREWSVNRTPVEVIARRFQVPLRLAWALTIHKCQGMELDCAEISMDRMWDFGQAYVALSRVKSLDGLYLTSFDPSKVRAHPEAMAFYEQMSKGNALAPQGLPLQTQGPAAAYMPAPSNTSAQVQARGAAFADMKGSQLLKNWLSQPKATAEQNAQNRVAPRIPSAYQSHEEESTIEFENSLLREPAAARSPQRPIFPLFGSKPPSPAPAARATFYNRGLSSQPIDVDEEESTDQPARFGARTVPNLSPSTPIRAGAVPLSPGTASFTSLSARSPTATATLTSPMSRPVQGRAKSPFHLFPARGRGAPQPAGTHIHTMFAKKK